MDKKSLKLTCGRKIFLFSVFSFLFGIDSVNAQTCEEPTISANPETICLGTSTTLSAVSDGEVVFWYASESATSSIGEGTSFTTPILTSDTSYWVESVNYGTPGTGTVITGGARVAPSSNSGSAVVATTSPWGLVFDAYEDFVLNSVDVFITASAGGNIVVNLLDNSWNVMETTSLTLPAGGSSSSPLQHTITLDFDVPQGNEYRLVASSSPTMVREFSTEHSGFPYSIGAVGAVTAGSINTTGGNPTVYYFFYNWTVTAGTPPEECISDRIEVLVTVTPLPNLPDGDSTQTVEEGSLVSDLEVTGQNLIWYADADLTQEIPSTTELVNGAIYYVTQTVEDCTSEALAITVTTTLNVDNFNKYNFIMYPNPVSEVLNLRANQEISNIEVFNLLGQKMDVSISNNQLDMTLLSKGNYILNVTIEGITKTFKVSKR